MREASATPASIRAEAGPIPLRDGILLGALSVLVSVATTWIALGFEGFGNLGLYFDGHFYLEIARSFPLPYSPSGRDYLGHAPGFPALIALMRVITPDAIHWGWLALAATWLSGITAVFAFYLLCREVDVPALPASLTFMAFSPSWVLVTSAAHPEPLAMTFALLCFVAHQRGSLPWSIVWLSLAMLTRYPAILLGGALAFDLLVIRRQLAFRTFAWLAVPLAVFALYNGYLAWRVPGFTGLWDTHQVLWLTSWTVPYTSLIERWAPMAGGKLFQREVIYGTVALYSVASLIGLRPSERRYWWLALWAAPILLFHVSLAGREGVDSFSRLAQLAWPAAVLIVWRSLPGTPPLAAVALTVIALGSFGIWSSYQKIRAAVYVQNATLWMRPKIRDLATHEPRWIDFKELKDLDRVRLDRRRKREQLRLRRGVPEGR